jgi:uncharacterized damage-inducible protein DinB
MSLRGCVVACCMLSAVGPLVAQSPAPDKLTGTWTGELIPPNATARMPVVVAIKLAANGSITGTITGPPQPGDIKSGSFDPRTGALKLEVVVRGDAATRAIFEGKVQGDTAFGQVTVDGQPGDFRLVKSSDTVAPGQPATAAPAAPRADDPVAMVSRGFTEVTGWVLRAAEVVPADKYGYRPVATVRTFAQLIGHVADSHNYYCGRAAGKKVEWSDAIEKGAAGKAALVQKLKQSIDGCAAAYGGAGQVGPLTENFGHTSLHYGNMVTYIRMLGLKPPSS